MGRLAPRIVPPRYDADEHYTAALNHYRNLKTPGEFDKAMDRINLALELLPNNVEYRVTRGLLHLENGVEDQARADFEAALRRHPADAMANYGLGLLAFRAREWDTARTHLAKAAVVARDHPEIPYLLALTYHRQQRNAEARDAMQSALDAMERTNDRRKGDARRWLREFERLAEAQTAQDNSEA